MVEACKVRLEAFEEMAEMLRSTAERLDPLGGKLDMQYSAEAKARGRSWERSAEGKSLYALVGEASNLAERMRDLADRLAPEAEFIG